MGKSAYFYLFCERGTDESVSLYFVLVALFSSRCFLYTLSTHSSSASSFFFLSSTRWTMTLETSTRPGA